MESDFLVMKLRGYSFAALLSYLAYHSQPVVSLAIFTPAFLCHATFDEDKFPGDEVPDFSLATADGSSHGKRGNTSGLQHPSFSSQKNSSNSGMKKEFF